MKKLLIAISALFFIAAAVQAQTAQADTTKFQKKHRGSFARNRVARPIQNLNLSEEQKKQFKEQTENFRQQAVAVRNSNLNADEKKTKLQALRKEQAEKTQSILTSEQKTQIADRKKLSGERKRPRTAFNRTKRLDHVKTKLALTDEQAAKLKTSQQGFREKIKSIHQDSNLSKEQKKEQVKALAKEQKVSMKSILTPEQLEKLKTGRKSKKVAK